MKRRESLLKLFRWQFVVVLLLLSLPVAVWGQSIPDGLYYIKIEKDNVYVWRAIAEKTSGQPYLSGLQQTSEYVDSETGIYGPANCTWVIKQVVVDENTYYVLINVATNQYVVWDTYESGTGFAVHLETRNTEPTQTSEHCFFKYETSGSDHYFHPDQCNTTTIGFNYKGDFSVTDKLRNRNNIGRGLIQFYDPAANSYETASLLAAPIISDRDENAYTFTITDANNLPAGYTIRYTTDGTDPTATTGDVYTGPVRMYGAMTVKAVVVRYGLVLTQIATKEFSSLITFSFDNITSALTLTSSIEGVSFYYTMGDGSQADPTTSSVLYEAPIEITTPTTVKAIAYRSDLGESTVSKVEIMQVATPTIQNSGSNSIVIATATPGATIYYTTDGTDPSISSSMYINPLTENASNALIKAIAVKEGMVTSVVGSGTFMLKCAAPVITRIGTTFTLSCSFPIDASLYYTLGSGSETLYSGPVSFTTEQLPINVTAVARHDNYTQSETATMELKNGSGTSDDPFLIFSVSDFSNFVNSVNNGSSASYKLGIDIAAGGVGAITEPFTGIFDGGGYTIMGLTHPLFNTVNGGVVKNVMLKSVAISSDADTVGAIACVAKGYSRIYNCGILPGDASFPDGTHPYVSTSGYCAGGLVGSLRDDSRVVNCFSYADVSATSIAAGIVGRNTYASTADVSGDKYTKLRTAVVNCFFYGDITGGTNQYGVYGGELITNADAKGISSYNYYRKGSTFSCSSTYGSGEPTAYNCSFPADERYLTQVEFHRSLLNSNRELCGWWVGSDVAPSTMTTAEVQAIAKDASLIYKWVVDPNLAPYPILKPFGKYPSVVNCNTGTPWFNRATANDYEGKQLGTLTVTVESGDYSSAANQTLYIPITDMDTLHFDFGYRKVQLPYFNTVFGNPDGATWAEKYAGNYSAHVVTGWKVTAVTGGTQGTFLADWQDGYNFADRQCTNKDLFSVSQRVFAQGGNYYVPDGVTAITIEAYWAEAIYVENNEGSYDRVNITENSTGYTFAPAGTRPAFPNGQAVSTSKIRDVIDAISQKKTVYDYAIVLVGNVQESNSNYAVTVDADKTRGFTIMSVDLDFDEEPDYCLEWQLGTGTTRNEIAPIRFDFLPVVELGIAGKLHNSTNFFSLGCFRSNGHFEVTETAFIRFGQFEFELQNRDDGPIILNGGIYDQYCRGRNNETNQHITYVILGGHVVMPSFTPGAHVSGNYKTRHCAVNALGGDFTSFYLTGGYNETIVPYEDNPHCYIDGGRFGQVAAAYKEGIYGDVTWRINHAIIREFYGGGVMAQATDNNYKIVKGSIDVVIDNSIVGKYCGGPKFGDMVSGKTVTTHATNTVFNQYFGAGNGGTNYMQYASTDATGNVISDWSNTIDPQYHPGQYRNSDQGYEADYDYEVINTSTGTQAGNVVNRSYYYSAQFATTNTGNVTSTLNGCTIKSNFYGGGFLGGVTGNVTSTLTDTRVYGSVFGAGYSADAGTVTIHNKDKNSPVANVYTGMITYNPEGTGTTYHWTNKHGDTDSPASTVDGDNYFFTEVTLEGLGTVRGNTILTINGNSEIGTENDSDSGHVYGGGDESAVTGNTIITISGNTIVNGNVYGGGNQGVVNGATSVRIE